MKVTIHELDPNKTFQIRIAKFTLVSIVPVIGTMEVTEYKTSDKKQIKKYAIREEETSEKHSRTFRCTKPGGQEYYHVSIHSMNQSLDNCDCKAYLSNKTARCIHIQSIRGIMHKRGMENDD